MTQCSERYLSLCATPTITSREGYSGINANTYLPFYGFYFFSGAQYTFPGSTIAQNNKTYIGGIKKCDTFQKEGCETCS